MNHSGIDHGVGTVECVFIILAQAPIVEQPGERSFDDPAPVHHDKALGVFGALHHVNFQTAVTLNTLDKLLATKPPIDPHQLKPWKTLAQRIEEPFGPGSLTNVGFSDQDFQQQP